MGSAGTTCTFCVIGDPVVHSLSPFIMNRAFAQRGIDAVYTTRRVTAGALAAAIEEMSGLGYGGCNVTFPLKEAVRATARTESPRAALIGAANTLCFTPAGVEAHNTDAPGVAFALAAFGGLELRGLRVVIFGAGGSARAAALGLLEAGAIEITFVVRNPRSAADAVQRLAGAFPQRSIRSIATGSPEARARREEAIRRADIVINATPVGMNGGVTRATALLEDAEWIEARHCCFDFVYHPRETAFLRVARSRGARCVEGLSLLVSQALGSFRIWTGREFDCLEMARVVEAEADRRERGDGS
jgi:shikimate dehydrogenase